MKSQYTIPLKNLINEFHLEELYMPTDPEQIMVASTEVDRPGLAIAGYTESFEPLRIQIVGRAEHAYIKSLSEEEQAAHLIGVCSTVA